MSHGGTRRTCGDFETPTNRDLGSCHPYRVKLPCGPNTSPPVSNPSDPIAVPDPGGGGGYVAAGYLLDHNLEIIKDHNNIGILATID